MTSSWSPWAQKLLIELGSCGKAKRREAVTDLVAKNLEVTVLPLLHKVKEAQQPKRTQKKEAKEGCKVKQSQWVWKGRCANCITAG